MATINMICRSRSDRATAQSNHIPLEPKVAVQAFLLEFIESAVICIK